MNEQAVIKLELKVIEVNLIMAALAKQPYETVFALLEEIKKQGQQQLQQKVEIQSE